MDKEFNIKGIGAVSEELYNVMQMCETILKEHPAPLLTNNYFIVALIDQKDNEAYKFLNKFASSYSLSSIKSHFLNEIEKTQLLSQRPNISMIFHKQFLTAVASARQFQDLDKSRKGNPLDSLCVLAGIIETDKAIFKTIQNMIGIDNNIINRITSLSDTIENITNSKKFNIGWDLGNDDERTSITILPFPEIENITGGRNKKNTALDTFCVNLNEATQKGKIDKIIGREKELAEIYRVLGRRKKNNLLLLGEPGVGKTSVVYGLVRHIVEKTAPNSLWDKKIYMLDIASLIAGTQLRGMMEERLKAIINEVKEDRNKVLFIDNIEMLMSQGKSDVDMSAIVNQALGQEEIQVIGTSNYKNYRSSIETNTGFERKFQKIDIPAPSQEETLNILNGIKKYYERYHDVRYTPQAINACIRLAEKYISDRMLPDSAIDIFDEAGSQKRLSILNTPEIKQYNDEISKLETSLIKDRESGSDMAAELQGRLAELRDKRHIALSAADKEVNEDIIYNIVSHKTGIPIASLSTDEKKSLVSINEKMKKVIIGQDEAIDLICKAVKRNRVGLGNSDKPVTFLELGQTGVGKTLSAKTLAKEVFGDEKYLIRFDMSEYSDKTAVNKLIGTGAGYIGYDNGGLLTEAIKKNKYCVLLCDEIEKADPEIYNVFLQIMDEGRLTDNLGKKVDCKNLILIFTSNIGARQAEEESKSLGFHEQNADAKARVVWKRELKNKFSPEFLNRIDNIIYFNSLTEENLCKIIELELNKVKEKVVAIKSDLTYDESVVKYILKQISDEKEFGARPIMRVLSEEIVNPITDLLLESDTEGRTFNLCIENEKLCIK